MHHSKELAFTFIMMLIFSRCTVSLHTYSTLYMAHSIPLACFYVIELYLILESESFKPGIFKTQNTTALYFYFLLHTMWNGDKLCQFNIQSTKHNSYDASEIDKNVILNTLRTFHFREYSIFVYQLGLKHAEPNIGNFLRIILFNKNLNPSWNIVIPQK